MRINGREIAQSILESLKHRIAKLDHMAHLAVIRVGDDPAITSYINQKEKMAKEIGVLISVYKYPMEVTNQNILEAIDFLQTKGKIDGIILQLPLPKHLDEEKLLSTITPDMDVDGFHPQSPFIVPLASAVLHILEYVYELTTGEKEETLMKWLKSQQIAVLGKGKTGGQPIIDLLRKLKLNPTVIDSTTQNPEEIIRQSDIIISAVGKREVVKKEMLKEGLPAGRQGVILIGIGMHRGTDGKFYGDYDENEIKDTAEFYTPIPGGVGPVNVAKLMENLVIATEKSVTQENLTIG